MKYVTYIYFFTIILNMTLSLSLMSQNTDSLNSLPSNDLEMTFVRNHISQTPDSLYFNILKIDNTTQTAIVGKVNLNFPSNFQLISPNNSLITIPAMESVYFPVRASIPFGAEGNKSYLVVADFKYGNKIVTKNNYIDIIGKRKWNMYIEQKNFYVSEYKNIYM